MLMAPLVSRIGRKKMRFFIANINQKDLLFLKDLLEAGKVAPVIDRRYPLRDAAEALRYLEERHARGKFILTIDHSIGTEQDAAATPICLGYLVQSKTLNI